MTQPAAIVPPSPGDAALLTVAAASLLASEFPQALTADQQHTLGVKAVDAVMILWNEIQTRIASGVLVSASE